MTTYYFVRPQPSSNSRPESQGPIGLLRMIQAINVLLEETN